MGLKVDGLPMESRLKYEITFARLSEIAPNEIIAHMSDPRVAKHMPLGETLTRPSLGSR